jgi:hypothetical protein
MCEPQRDFKVYLSGNQEVPPLETEAKAKLQLHFTKDLSTIEFEIEIKHVQDVVSVHLHIDPPGEVGEIAVELYSKILDINVKNNPLAPRCIKGRVTNADLLLQLVTVVQLYQYIREGKLYCDVHTVTNPLGLLRGQIFTA